MHTRWPPRSGTAVLSILYLAGGPAAASEPAIGVVLDNQPATLFSISGAPRAAGALGFDVFAVGASSPDGRGPLLLRYDGASWQRLTTGEKGDLDISDAIAVLGCAAYTQCR